MLSRGNTLPNRTTDMEKQEFIYKGWLSENGDNELLLEGEPLTEKIADNISVSGKNVSVRYFVSDIEVELADAEESVVKTAMGATEAEFVRMYGSSWTGYYGTDETFIVGGHDLLAELRTAKGKYLILEITTEQSI